MEPVETREMEYILTLAEERSFSRAAERCYISQPQLSKIIRRAEGNMGFALFDRSTHPLKLTPEGEIVLQHLRRIRGEMQELARSCGTLRKDQRADLTVGAPSFFCTHSLPPVIRAFGQEAPGFQVRLIETNDQDLRALLASGTADLGITVNTELAAEFPSEVIRRETLVLAVPAAFPVNQGLENLALSRDDLCEEALRDPALPGVGLGAFRETDFLLLRSGNDLRTRAVELCQKAGFYPRITMELDQLLTAYYLASAGLGATFARASTPWYTGFPDALRFYKIEDPLTARNVFLLRRPEGHPGPAGQDFVRFLKQYPFPGQLIRERVSQTGRKVI